jgi:hypothetical protein
MTEMENSIKTITKWLSVLCSEVVLRNSLNLQDINVIAENFYRDLLNLLYGYSLKNANHEKQNVASIDLFDDEKRLAIQVTSDNSSAKVHDTIHGFNEGSLYKKYDRLIVLVITTKLDFPKTKFKNVGNVPFSKEHDIIDVASILKDIADLKLEKLQIVEEFIVNQVATKASFHKRNKESNEVETIMKLIEYLSTNSDIDNSTEKEPDPEGKFLLRFADYADYLINRYKELAYIYIMPLKTAEKEIGLDKVKTLKIRLYLKRVSNRYLNEKGGNPQEAIDAMVIFFSSKLSGAIFDFDETAAEFYLIDEMIKCNVFPNP